MKPNITQGQFDELPSAHKEILAHWAGEGMNSTLSIADMIGILDERIGTIGGWWQMKRAADKTAWRVDSKYILFAEDGSPELCDALWEAIKVLLEEAESEA